MMIWLNGTFVHEEAACLSPLDRGFLYGDGLFETLRCAGGLPCAFDAHLRRLERGMKALGLTLPFSRDDLHGALRNLCVMNDLAGGTAAARLTVTRGVTAGLRDFEARRPTVLIHLRPVDESLLERQRAAGIRAIIVPGGGRFLPGLKHCNYLPSLVALRAAATRNADEAIFTDSRGRILEGATTNIFFCDRRGVVTPPAAAVLPGITRATVIKVLRKAGVTIHERHVTIEKLTAFTGAFLTGSVIGILPLRRLGSRSFSVDIVNRLCEIFRASTPGY